MTSRKRPVFSNTSLGFNPETITNAALRRVLVAAWLERQEFIKAGILTGSEARARYDRFEYVRGVAASRGIDASTILQESSR